MVYRNATKLKYLIEQLLDFRKVEVGKLVASYRKVELNKFVKEEVDHFDFILRDKGLDLLYDLKKESINTNIDTEKTAKIIFNLLSNAVKYTKQGYIEIGIDTCEMGNPAKEFAKIWVKDTGIGIKNEKIDRIFDRFFNDSQSATDSSYGIGLSHCKDLIEVMKGSITVESIQGNGSTFTVYLPMELDKIEQTIEAIPAIKNKVIKENFTDNNEEITAVKLTKLQTVLIAEDNPEMREYIKSCLSEQYNILEAENGADGFDLSKKKMPDLIVSDYVMPIMNGIEFCEKIKTTLETSHIPVILLTARTDNEIKLKGLETGADDYISKPFETDYLLTKIRSLIKNRDSLRQLFQNNIVFEPSKITVTSTDEKFLNDLMKEIEKGIPDSDYTVDNLEKEMSMSHAKFYNKVKNLTGLSGKELLQDFRLKRAAQIITENDVSVADVCYMVGFSDPKYFSACFKAKFKVTPTEYKANYKNGSSQQ